MRKFFIIILLFSGIIPSVFGEAFIENDQQHVADEDSLHIVRETMHNLKIPLNQINVK